MTETISFVFKQMVEQQMLTTDIEQLSKFNGLNEHFLQLVFNHICFEILWYAEKESSGTAK